MPKTTIEPRDGQESGESDGAEAGKPAEPAGQPELGPPYADEGELPPPRPAPRPSLGERLRSNAYLLLTLYYVLLIGVAAVLIYYIPAVHDAFLTPIRTAETAGAFTGQELPPVGEAEALTLDQALARALGTLIASVGALLLVMPVARVYMHTKRLRYDPSLVRSVIILPLVVAGITVVVKNSIALAFSLAGIVAAVRFRITLKDSRDAVYIFLVISIGLAAGVQALDVALVTSAVFNYLMLLLWQRNVGSIYSGRYARTGVLSTGASELLVAQSPRRRQEIRSSLLDEAEEMKKTTGILLVHVHQPELARHTVQEALSDMAKDWRLVRIVPRDDDLSTLEYVIRLRKKVTAPELVGALDERWSEQVVGAEYIPFRARKRERDDDDE